MQGIGGDIIEVGVTIGVVLAVVGIGQFGIRMWSARRLMNDPNNLTSQALLMMY